MALTIIFLGDPMQGLEDLASRLQDKGYTVRECADWEGLSAAVQAPVQGQQALFLDLDEHLAGVAELKRLKETHPGIHFLAASSRSHNPEMAECIEKHFFALLKKPVDPEELLYLLGGISKLGE